MTMSRLVEEVAAASVAATANVTQKRASGQGGIGGDDDDDEDVASPPSFSVVDAAMVNFKKMSASTIFSHKYIPHLRRRRLQFFILDACQSLTRFGVFVMDAARGQTRPGHADVLVGG